MLLLWWAGDPVSFKESVKCSVQSLGGYDNVELHGPGLSINCLGRRVTSYTTRDAREIARLLAMVP